MDRTLKPSEVCFCEARIRLEQRFEPLTSDCKYHVVDVLNSVTRLGNLLDFGKFLKPLATIN